MNTIVIIAVIIISLWPMPHPVDIGTGVVITAPSAPPSNMGDPIAQEPTIGRKGARR